jgi:hypothetical protein
MAIPSMASIPPITGEIHTVSEQWDGCKMLLFLSEKGDSGLVT